MNRSKHILLLCSIGFLTGFSLKGQNILANSSFESGPVPWVTGSWGGPSASFSVSTEAAQEGLQSMKVVVQSTDSEAGKVFLRQEGLLLDLATTYTLSFQVLSNSGQTESLNVQLYSHQNIGGSDWGIAFIEDEINFEGDEEWHAFSFEFTPSVVAGAPDFNNLGLMFGFARNANTFYVDQVVLSKEMDVPPAVTSVYHVGKKGSDENPGTKEQPFSKYFQSCCLNAGRGYLYHPCGYL